MNTEKIKIIFLGTPQIAIPTLEFLINKDDVDVLAVVTQPDKKAGRGHKICTTPVCCIAKEHDIAVYQPTSIKKEPDIINALRELEPDFFVTFAFGQMLSQEIIDIPQYGCINLHASLLPKYRGANPIQAPIIDGDNVTGITTMITELSMDTGPIVKQQEIKITENMTSADLYNIIELTSPEFIYDSLKGLKDKSITPAEQYHRDATLARKVKKEDGLIDWTLPAKTIHNQVRGLQPWPGTFTYINGTCMKINQTRLCNEGSGQPGEILGKYKTGIKVATGNNECIVVTKIQPACKKEQDAASWLNGARLEKGVKFESITPEQAESCECECKLNSK